MDVDTSQLDFDLQSAPGMLTQKIGQFNLPGGIVFSPNLLHAGFIVLGVFLALIIFARMRKRESDMTTKAVLPAIAFGFVLAIILEAVLLVGGRTIFTELLGWKNAPKPLSNALDASRAKLVEVMGVTDPVPDSLAETPHSAEEMVVFYDSLDESNKKDFLLQVCPKE